MKKSNHGGISALALTLVLSMAASACSSDDTGPDSVSSGALGADQSQVTHLGQDAEDEIAEACGALLVAPTLVALLGLGGQPSQYELLDEALAGGAKHFPEHTENMERHRSMLGELAEVSAQYDIEANPDDIERLLPETQAVFDDYGGLEAVVEQFVAWSEDPCGVWLDELLGPISDGLG